MDNPCYECEFHSANCHGTCKRYKAFRTQLDEKNEKANADKKNAFDVYMFHVEGVEKQRKRRRSR